MTLEREPERNVLQAPAGITLKRSPRSVAETVERLTKLIEAKGMQLFAVIDHSGVAAAHGLQLRDTKVVIFGSPEAGTPVMQASPFAALDLPLKVLVWAEGEAAAVIAYAAPAELARRYGLSSELGGRLAGIDPLTDALVASL